MQDEKGVRPHFQSPRERYAQAVRALAEARAAYNEAEGLVAFLAGFPDARFKTTGGWMRNNHRDPLPWEQVHALLVADAQPREEPTVPAYAQPLQPREQAFGVSGTPNMESARASRA